MTAVAEAWLLGSLLAATLGAGALAAMAAGMLLRESWLEPLRPAFLAAGRAMPALILLAAPLVLWAPRLWPWTDRPRGLAIAVSTAGILVLWSILGRWLNRPTAARWPAGVPLMLMVLSAAIGFEDWGLSRDAGWTGSLQGIAMIEGGAAAFLALAVLFLGCPEDPEARTGLERALLTLGIFALWLLFVQFITVWAADLPAEAAWYGRRQEGVWFWVQYGVVLPALAGAVALAAVPQWRPWRMRAVCALLVLHHLAGVAWAVRPDAALAPGAALGRPDPLTDAIVIAGIAALVAVAVRLAGRGGRAHV